MRTLFLAVLPVVCLFGASAQGLCVSDPVNASTLQFDPDYLFRSLDASIGTNFPAWLTRWQQQNTTDPTPTFYGEDNSQNGIVDADQLDMLAAVLTGEPVATVMPGVNAANITAIRASYTANRAKVRPDLTLTVFIIQVNIIDEINKGDPTFGSALQDMVAAYMTIGDDRSVAFIRGLLITLGDIFIEVGVADGTIPALAESATKNALRTSVNGNFIASRYECYGDASGATKPNLLGASGNLGGSGLSNLAEYQAQGGNRQAWLIAKGIAQPPLQIVSPSANLSVGAGTPTSITPGIAGGTGAAITYDWKRVTGGVTAAAASGSSLSFAYPLAGDTGTYQLYVCDGTWQRHALPFDFTVNAQAFALSQQPQGATRTVGQGVTFTVGAVGGEVLPTYAWYYGASANSLTLLPGETANTLTIDPVALEDAGFYQARVTGGAGAAPTTLQTTPVELVVQEQADTTAPVISLTGAQNIEVPCGGTFSDPGATATDETDGDLTGQIQVTGSVNTGTASSYTLTYSVADAAGNPASVQRFVNVVDNTDPVITVNGDTSVVVACKGVFNDPGATGFDACDGAVNVNVLGTVDTTTPGLYTLTYSAGDNAGNNTSAVRTVEVVDTVEPILTRIGAAQITLACGGVVNDPGVQASDACAGDLTSAVLVGGTVNANAPGTYTRTYTVSDPSGNSASTTRTYVVTDTTPPALTLTGANPLVVACGTAFNDLGATALDACEGLISGVQVSGNVETATPGDYAVTYSVADSTGNVGQVSRTVQVKDLTPPVVTLFGAAEITVGCGQAFADPGATANDACAGAVVVTSSGDVNPQTPGDYTVSYSATDPSGNTGSATRTVRVRDTTPPVIALNGPGTLNVACGAVFQDPGATANDACAGSLTPVVTGSVDTASLGDYTLTYTAEDPSGNAVDTTRTVRVSSNASPTLTLIGGEQVDLACGSAFAEPGYTASAPCEGDLGSAVVVSGAVDTATPGNYTLSYSVSSEAGVVATATRTVRVTDTAPPVITLLGEAQVDLVCGQAYTEAGASALDLCEGDVSPRIVIGGSVNTDVPGDYAITYDVSDSAGNTARAMRPVRVSASGAGNLTLLGENSITLSCGDTFVEPGFTATDACGNDAAGRVVITGNVSTSRPGTYTLTYTLDATQRTRSVTVLPDCAITLTQQPSSQSLYVGQRAEFGVSASGGSAVLSYQWYQDDTAIDGANDSTYVIDAVVVEDAADYTCAVSDGFSTITTDPATLSVFARPVTGQQSADTNGDWSISLSELLRVIQFYNTGALSCLAGTEDGYTPGPGDQTCAPHGTDYNPQDWSINLSELLRAIQFFNTPGGAYHAESGTEDGFAPGAG